MKTILIVDDTFENLYLLRVILEEAGYLIVEAKDGKEGLKKFKSFKPDIVITDIMMPLCDGLEMTQKIKEFEIWRIKKAGRLLNKSTLLNHNAALQMVFKEAVEKQWMLAVQVPVLSATGEQGARRAAFTREEYEQVLETIESMRDNSRKDKTRQIRELLLDYAEIVVNTGIRPGTEMEELTWGDIEMTRQDHQVIFKIKSSLCRLL